MGEPAIPTKAERAATLELARRIVEAVRNDEEGPAASDLVSPFLRDNARRARANGQLETAEAMEEFAERLDLETFRLAQDLDLTTVERDQALADLDMYRRRDRRFARQAPVVNAAIHWYRSSHTRDANCCAGDHDDCTRKTEERELSAVVVHYLEQPSETPDIRAELVRLRAVWNDDQGLLADHRFVDAVCALLDQEPG